MNIQVLWQTGEYLSDLPKNGNFAECSWVLDKKQDNNNSEGTDSLLPWTWAKKSVNFEHGIWRYFSHFDSKHKKNSVEFEHINNLLYLLST